MSGMGGSGQDLAPFTSAPAAFYGYPGGGAPAYNPGYGGGGGGQPCGMGYPVAGCGGGGGYGQQQQGDGSSWLSKRNLGGLGGAAAGGLAGAQIGSGSGQLAATAGGALLGLFLGAEVGASLDRADEAHAYMELQRSLTLNQPVVWQGQSGTSAGRITPLRKVPKKVRTDPTCREFRHQVLIGDKQQEGVGKACLQKDGSWKLVAG